MKQLLTLLLLTLGTAAFANTDKNTEPKPAAPAVESHETIISKKTTAKVQAQDNAVAKPAKKETQRAGTTKTCTTVERSSLGISGYFVDFVHNSNVKLVKLLMD